MTSVERYTNYANVIGARAQQYALSDERFHERAIVLAQEAAHCAIIAISLAEVANDASRSASAVGSTGE